MPKTGPVKKIAKRRQVREKGRRMRDAVRTGDLDDDPGLFTTVMDELGEGLSTMSKDGLPVDFVEYGETAVTLSRHTKQMVNRVSLGSNAIKPEALVRNLSRRFPDKDEGERIDWAKLGKVCNVFFRSPPFLSFLRPCTKRVVEKKVARPRRAPVEATNDELKQADEVAIEQKEGGISAQDMRVMALRSLLLEKKNFPITFLLNPESLGQTVENFYDFSILVKDGHVGMKLNKEGMPYLVKKDTLGATANEADLLEYNDWSQNVFSFDMEEYEGLVKKFRVKNCGVGHREIVKPEEAPVKEPPKKRRRKK